MSYKIRKRNKSGIYPFLAGYGSIIDFYGSSYNPKRRNYYYMIKKDDEIIKNAFNIDDIFVKPLIIKANKAGKYSEEKI